MLRLPTLALISSIVACQPANAQQPYDLDEVRAAWSRGETELAAALIEPLAIGGDKTAQFELALMYANGLGVPQDGRKFAGWLRRSANSGHLDAQYLYGTLVYRGQFVVQNHKEAAAWFRKAADAGHAEAQFNLGLMYERGDGVRQDDIEAHKWLNLAVSNFADQQERQRASAKQARDRVAQRLSPLHLSIAQRLAADWNNKDRFARP